jgi:hypothetical protein
MENLLPTQNLLVNTTELLEFVNSCLKPKQKEKQENGEVFTPITIIIDILSNLDKYYTKANNKSIFSEPNLKWFDPASGIGNFLIVVYLKLMDGLEFVIPHKLERKKHILEKMLYMSEINENNILICKKIFNYDNEYTLNLHEGDTLNLNIKKVWNLSNYDFDIIIGNPPYNKGGIRSRTGKHHGEKNETIWPKFIDKSFQWLKPNGYLSFINPLGWLKKSHYLHNVLVGEKEMVWMKLWDNIKSCSSLNAEIPVSLFILKNTKNVMKRETEIISEIQSKKLVSISYTYLDPNYSIPLACYSIFKKLRDFIESKNIFIDYKTKSVKTIGSKIQLPPNYKSEDMWAVDTYTIKEGIMVKKALELHPDFYKRKLIISNKSSFTGSFIEEGTLGLCGRDKSYILGDNLELILKMINFKISYIICHFTKYRQYFLDKEVYSYLPDIRKLGIKDIKEEEFYDLIGLTQEEINQINKITNNYVK